MITNLTITKESFDSLTAFRSGIDSSLNWNLVFTLPGWLKAWWQNFGSGAELHLRSVKQQDKTIGIAPLQIRDGTASIIGSANVCDYQDFIVAPGSEKDFYNTILDDLCERGVERLHLETIRPDSTIITHLMPIAKGRQYSVDYRQVDVSSDMILPPTWDEYLDTLESKQRHELKRKMRNLQRIGNFNYRVIEAPNAISEGMNNFLKLFPEYRCDKAEFLTAEMQGFFHSLATNLADGNVVKFGVLESNQEPIAMVMYFDYNNNIYLYNSAYNPDYRSKSVGIISKAECIQHSIEKGKTRFDFLKGSEQYKYYLGGKEIPLFSCAIDFKQGAYVR